MPEKYELLLKDSYNLDVWNGSNHSWGGKFTHAILHKLIKVDGEPTEDVLWETYTQWQGNIPSGRILSRKKALLILEDEGHPKLEEIRRWLTD